MNHKILIVEDEDDISTLVAMRAQSEGLQVLIDRTGHECVSLCEVHKPDVVLLDIELPERNGLDLIKEIRQHEALKKIPLIVHSSHTERDLIQNCLKEGASGYFVKGEELDVLFELVEAFTGIV